MKKILLLTILFLNMSGCASLMDGKNQAVSVQTHEKGAAVTGANCSLANDKGTWFVTTPGSVVIQKSYGDLMATCNKDGYSPGVVTFSSTANGGAWGNILAGGGIGYIIDRSSGAGFNYPSMLNIELGVNNSPPVSPNKNEKPSQSSTQGDTSSSSFQTVDRAKPAATSSN